MHLNNEISLCFPHHFRQGTSKSYGAENLSARSSLARHGNSGDERNSRRRHARADCSGTNRPRNPQSPLKSRPSRRPIPIQYAGYVILRLPYQVKDLFDNWLKRHFPDREQKVLQRLRAIRKGKLNHSAFHNRMKGDGVFAEQIRQMFQVAGRKAGLNRRSLKLSTAHFRRQSNQLERVGAKSAVV